MLVVCPSRLKVTGQVRSWWEVVVGSRRRPGSHVAAGGGAAGQGRWVGPWFERPTATVDLSTYLVSFDIRQM